MAKVVLFASTTGYQVREFDAAASSLGVELVLATDRCHILDDPWADRAVAVRFDDPEFGMAGLAARGPFDGILAVGDRPAIAAADATAALGLRFHSPEAARAANDKFLTRESFRVAGLRVPRYRLVSGEGCADALRYPCVLKPLHLSASQGVIRANNAAEFRTAFSRMAALKNPVLVEDFIPGREFALEGVVARGRLRVLALFDKPDPLDGPYFEETIYITPSRESLELQEEIQVTTERAAAALGLTDGPIHAEMRVNEEGVWMLEIAARPIGGLCARALRFSPEASLPEASLPEASLEELLLRHSVGEDLAPWKLAPGSHGVMMIPVPRSGIYRSLAGVAEAEAVPGVEAVIITAKEGQEFTTLPEGSSYPGFIFARTQSFAATEDALRGSQQCLHFLMEPKIPIVR
jgi:biotin carboxylase